MVKMKTTANSDTSSGRVNCEQVESLSSLIPFYKSEPLDHIPILFRTFELFQNAALRNFLLNDISTHLQAVTTPSNASRARAYVSNTVNIATPIFSLHRTCRYQKFISNIPVFQSGSITFGIFLKQEQLSRFKDVKCTERDQGFEERDTLWQGRYLRDGRDGSCATFLFDECQVRVVWYTFDTPNSSANFQFVLCRRTLMKLLQGYSNVDMSCFMLCVRSLYSLARFHNCPRCDSPPTFSCLCARQELIKLGTEGSLDLFAGSSCGIGHEFDVINGSYSESRAHGYIVNSYSVDKTDRTSLLLKRAAKEYIQELECNPWKSVLGEGGESCEERGKGRRQREHVVWENLTAKQKMRLEKNRECARRSNLKRKRENEVRRRELQGLKSLQTLLLDRERALRAENLMLRKLIQSCEGDYGDCVRD